MIGTDADDSFIGSEIETVLTLVSGNQETGIMIGGARTTVVGVMIGTNVKGVTAMANGYQGTVLFFPGETLNFSNPLDFFAESILRSQHTGDPIV